MLEALEEHFGEGASWTRPQGGLFIWATLDERIDTTDLLALAQKSESVAFVPGRAAYVDGRSGSASMRLNFAGMSEEDIREGIRRIGRAIREQLGLLGSLTGSPAPAGPAARSTDTTSEEGRPPANVVELPRRDEPARRTPHAGSMSEARSVAVLKGGRSLERAVSLRSGAHVQEALLRLGHEVRGIDAGPQLVADLDATRPDAAFIAVHGRDGEDGTIQQILDALGIAYTGSGPAACMRSTNKVLAKHLMREAGIPTPAFHAFPETSIRELGAGAAMGSVEEHLGFPMVVKPASGGSALGVKFARASAELPGALVGAFSYDRTVLIERYVKGRDLAVSVIDGEGAQEPPQALPIVEAVPREEEFYDYESRYEIGMTTFVCPAELPAETTARAQELALRVYELLGCRGVARVDLMLDGDGDLWVLETNVIPGMTETSLLPQAADAAGIDFDELVRRVLAGARSR